VKGIETYYMKVISEEVSISWPKKDDSNLSAKSKEAEIIIKSMINEFSSNLVQSEKLALLVQESIIHTLKLQYSDINNRGIKSAPFYIFLGNIIPTILIETGFVSNPIECERLLSEQYQEILCDGIIGGIENFINR
jgi:N-acetylmuramoyl-L-alanine amidase